MQEQQQRLSWVVLPPGAALGCCRARSVFGRASLGGVWLAGLSRVGIPVPASEERTISGIVRGNVVDFERLSLKRRDDWSLSAVVRCRPGVGHFFFCEIDDRLFDDRNLVYGPHQRGSCR